MFGWGSKVPHLSADDLADRLQKPGAPFILDVRSEGEFRMGHIPGAKLIPLNQIDQRQEEIPKDRPIVVVCHSGARSLAAARQLSGSGYDVYNLSGGMRRWTGKIV